MYHFKGSLKVGQINRFILEIEHENLPKVVNGQTLSVRVKNTTSALMRPALLAGPYILYMSIREQSYRHDTALGDGDFPPHFDANVKTNCSRWQSIPISPPQDTQLKVRTFEIDVVSQVIFSPSATVYFEVTIGRNKQEVRSASKHGDVIECSTTGLKVQMQDTESIWCMPPVPRDHPGHHLPADPPVESDVPMERDEEGHLYDHLVVLTHGIHANLTTDLLYLKEIIEKTAKKNGERVICKGFAGNACNTERGVKWLAENVGNWVLRETGWKCNNSHAVRMANSYKKISFISHSLGGLVQIYALGFLHDKSRGRIFKPEHGGLEPVNFITLATPWLGVSAENPAYFKVALDFGMLGKTGQDLGLTPKPLGEYRVHDTEEGGQPRRVRSKAPLLSLLSRPNAPSHIAIKLFSRRTVYANIENDGIVPLRTSSLYFLDWEGFSAEKVAIQKKLENRSSDHPENQPKDDLGANESGASHIYGMQGEHENHAGVTSERSSTYDVGRFSRPRSDAPDDYSSADELETSPQDDSRPATKTEVASSHNITRGLERTHFDGSVSPRMQQGSPETGNPALTVSHPTSAGSESTDDAGSQLSHAPALHDHRSPMRKVKHALNFTALIRRVSAGRLQTSGPTAVAGQDSDPEDQSTSTDDHSVSSPTTAKESPNKAQASGPSDAIEDASHSNSGLWGLLKPSQTHRKPSKAFTRSQTVPKDHENLDTEEMTKPQEPMRTSFFRALESVLNPPMPELDYITNPATREPTELVIVHDQFYYPSDIPPLKEIAGRAEPKKSLSHSAKKAEEKERIRLEKVKLEEKIARCWHQDMSWRKVLVKLKPDAHNNIIVRRTFANSFGWPVIDHLAEHHFGAAAKTNAEKHDEQESTHQRPEDTGHGVASWNRDYLNQASSDEEEGGAGHG